MRHCKMPSWRGKGDDHESPPLPQRSFHAFARAMHAHRQLMLRKLAEHGIHPSQAFCLREIAHNDGITQRDLAEALCISRPTLTVMLQKMEKARLVERRTDAADQRFTRIYLTAAGSQTHLTMHSVIDEVVAQVIGPLSDADQAELVRLLDLLHDNIAAALDAPAAPAADAAEFDTSTE